MRDRVERLRKGPETPPPPMVDNDGDNGSDIAANDDDNIGESPPTSEKPTPIWEPTREERNVIWPGKTKTTFDDTFNIDTFNIDTTKSFLDGSKPTGKCSHILTILILPGLSLSVVIIFTIAPEYLCVDVARR